jgi:hypothetical protein
MSGSVSSDCPAAAKESGRGDQLPKELVSVTVKQFILLSSGVRDDLRRHRLLVALPHITLG